MAKKEYLFWADFIDGSEQLAIGIQECFFQPTHIVAIAKGGLVLARQLATYLNIKRIYSLGIQFYTDINKTNKKPYIYQHLTEKFKPKDVILIVDDIADSGETFELAVKEVTKNKGKNIMTCSFYCKPKSKFKPDFVASQKDLT
jgi:hypoxanthine phosphoribosyltransferase